MKKAKLPLQSTSISCTVLTMASSLEARACEVCLTSVLVAGIDISLWLQTKEQSQMKIWYLFSEVAEGKV